MRILTSLILVTMMMVSITYADEPEKKQITVSAQWKIGPSTAYWIIAKEKGFYDNLGFEVNIVGNTSSKVVIAGLESGQLDFGSPSAYFLAEARAQGFKGKMLLCYVPMPQLGIIYHTDRGIKSPKDLEGKTLGGVPGTSDIMLFPRFAESNGISIEKVELKELSYGVLHGMFFEGKLDAMGTFMPYLPRYKSEGHKVAGFPYGDYGIYFSGVTTTEKFIKENPITTKRFIQATQKAFAWIYEHKNESIDLFFKVHPELKSDNPQADYDQFEAVMSTHYDEIGHKKGLGWMIDSKWQKTLQFAEDNFDAKINFSPSEIYTNEFLVEKN